MKKQLCLTILLMQAITPFVADAKDISQQQDISKLVHELDYLIQVTKKLKHKYRGDDSKITFDYNALIEQLRAAKAGSEEYLNNELYELHTAPPQTKYRNLTKVKP